MDTHISRRVDDNVTAGKTGLLLLADNFDAFAARVLAARSAVSSLDLMYYLWHDDHSGRLLMEEIVKAADRGVRVRMLLDDINPRNNDAAYVALNRHPNIELRLFNPSGLRSGRLVRLVSLASRLFAMMRRMHNKAWIADGRIAIVGGRNIGDAYFDAAATNFRDLDLVMVGPAAEQAEAIFESYWKCDMAVAIDRLDPAPQERVSLRRPIQPLKQSEMLGGISGASIDEFIAASSNVHWTAKASVISDPPEKVLIRRRRNWLMKQLLPLIRESRKTLTIVSPYFIPGRNGCSVLAGLVKDGIDVSILTNSLAATDVAAVHGKYAKYRRRLLRKGVKLFELQPFGRHPTKISVFGSKGASLHTKAFTVDEETCFVGSFNFDPRSVSVNTEMGVLAHDTDLADELRRWFEEEKAPDSAYRLFLDKGKLNWEGERDGQLQRYASEPEASLWRRAIALVVGWLPIESQL